MLSPFRPRPQRVFAGLTLLVALLLALPAHAQKQPGFQGPFALTNAQVIVAPGDTLDDGTVVIRDDSIAAVGPDVSVPSDAQAFDLSGQMVYPGFIDSGTHLGLAEIGSLPETQDFNEIGDLTAHMNALTAVNPSTVHVPTTRVHGITSVITEPENGILPGTAALIGLHGYTPEQMHLGDVTLTKLNFPSVGRQGPSDDRSPETIQKEAEKALTQLNDLWAQAERYARIDSAVAEQPEARRQPEFVPAMEGLLPVIRGEQPLMISANAAADISKALDWAEERGVLDQLILSGALEGWRVADEIAAANVPVLVGSIMQPPSRESDRYDKAYRTPALLHDAGVTVALRSGKTENVRNLVFHAGFAAAHGLGKTEALRAITTNPARIFGVADQVGTIEAGKRANLFVADGDPLQPATDVQHLFIDGYKLPLENRATKLYDEFLNRNPGLTK
ncbi:imidazolonepropionase-like amidohydrolase [Salinibacter ruber]|uniref:Imidazolonepropionase-like amidohydrolase n=1 Tax=Salinibacter ruber TaxID=146919 RepID=A0A9X2Q9I9_9BACT|nr:amidohydrolase family protein [Salinibacter ruber]MCS3661329.1 imidazolonepropionase-like amidohydrolase [Salinibacter ruber]MCS3670617.1 imidazolonepropionase-like amidohydrolase [Salinibacter ruber]MCS3707421.1 imidazolonepropionase-like amidohydrolase [Salinibacter ruber]MCS3711128.1 imidazolonepropionase-like amidohydrolase [Salinibacter ruber]MCS4031879.1 imidazolonepropionase-like amidohydrolase [Salinibacter ruber]